VEPGENIWDIAKAYGVSAATIASASGIDVKKKIFPGDRLTIPKPLLTTASIAASQSGRSNNPSSLKDEQVRIMKIEPEVKDTESLYSNPILAITGLRILTY
jgi:LysM repeat protein